jgi:hypothetical protein
MIKTKQVLLSVLIGLLLVSFCDAKDKRNKKVERSKHHTTQKDNDYPISIGPIRWVPHYYNEVRYRYVYIFDGYGWRLVLQPYCAVAVRWDKVYY